MDQVIHRCGDCQLDFANRRFTRDGKEYAVEPKVFAVLVQLLMTNAIELQEVSSTPTVSLLLARIRDSQSN